MTQPYKGALAVVSAQDEFKSLRGIGPRDDLKCPTFDLVHCALKLEICGTAFYIVIKQQWKGGIDRLARLVPLPSLGHLPRERRSRWKYHCIRNGLTFAPLIRLSAP